MRNLRRHPRVTDTRDLLASLRSGGRSRRSGRVLNLSQGGMLVARFDVKVGEVTNFELAGPSFRYAGVAEVAHQTDRSTGLRFLRWDGCADRPVRALIEQRAESQQQFSRDLRARDQRALRRVAVLIGTDRGSRRKPGSLG
jgi:hypothetical protein